MEESFEAVVQQLGKRIVVPLPFDPNEVWGKKARHDVTGTINDVRIRGPLIAENDQYFLALGPAWRRDSGIAADTRVIVHLAAEGPQVDAMAEDLVIAFTAVPAALAFFNALPTFYRKNYMRWVNGAKQPATRAKRIAEMIALLKSEKRER